MVSEKKILHVFPKFKSMKANDPQGMANSDHRVMVGRIYEMDH